MPPLPKIVVHEVWGVEGDGVGWPTVARVVDRSFESRLGEVGSASKTRLELGSSRGTQIKTDLLAVYSGNRRHHVCPFGQVRMIGSGDGGKSWGEPRVVVDGPLDDRDAGVIQTSRGTVIVNWFSSVTWREFLHGRPETIAGYAAEELAEWRRRDAGLSEEVVREELGVWCVRSEDGGCSWGGKIDTVVGSPHGPCELGDGRLLYVGKRRVARGSVGIKGGPFEGVIGAAESCDDGVTWRWLSEITPMAGHLAEHYHELHAVQCVDGRIVAHIRNHNEPHRLETLQTESLDGGRSWSAVRAIGVWGYPSFLMRAGDGRLVCSVSHRREPRGVHVSFSDDHGETWSTQQALNGDSVGDFGYPSTVEMEPGVFLTMWYDGVLGGGKTGLRCARWSVG